MAWETLGLAVGLAVAAVRAVRSLWLLLSAHELHVLQPPPGAQFPGTRARVLAYQKAYGRECGYLHPEAADAYPQIGITVSLVLPQSICLPSESRSSLGFQQDFNFLFTFLTI